MRHWRGGLNPVITGRNTLAMPGYVVGLCESHNSQITAAALPRWGLFQICWPSNKLCVGIISQSSINRELASQRRAEFGVPQGRQRAGRGKPAKAGAAPANKQKITEPRRKEWAAEGSASMYNRSLYHPLTPFGVQIIFMVSRGSVASRLHPCLPSYVPHGTQIPLR